MVGPLLRLLDRPRSGLDRLAGTRQASRIWNASRLSGGISRFSQDLMLVHLAKKQETPLYNPAVSKTRSAPISNLLNIDVERVYYRTISETVSD